MDCIFCKIIKNTKPKESTEYAEFVGDVAQASNNQKPIKSEDLIAMMDALRRDWNMKYPWE